MPSISSWTTTHASSIATDHYQAPLIVAGDVAPVTDDIGVWDAWPVQLRDGAPLILDGGSEIWMALAAPRFPDPDTRHGHARIHLFRRDGACWSHLGPAMPDDFSPGSREWSGSAIFDPQDRRITLYFTAAGRRGEVEPTPEQRIFSARATLATDGRCTDWRDLAEVVKIDPAFYAPTDRGGQIGTIKAFRDPSYFRDPASGAHYLYFSGSMAGSLSAFNGVVGLAVAASDTPDSWQLMPPLLSADGLNNELERPHIVVHGELFYLFWSTQQHVFDPNGPLGPTGLYGMVSNRPDGGWRPLNGSGLVFSNPAEAPAQAYSWLVLPDLSVTSFIDDWKGGPGRSFGGTFAPFLKLVLDGDRAGLESRADAV